MLKKFTAIFFILCANVIFLAHAVIPHHHHENKVCLTNSCCLTQTEDHNHETCNHNHHHDKTNHEKNDIQCCVLKPIAVLPSNSFNQEIKTIYYNFDNFQTVLLNKELSTYFPIIKPKTKLLIIPTTYSYYISFSSGLRAPPIS